MPTLSTLGNASSVGDADLSFRFFPPVAQSFKRRPELPRWDSPCLGSRNQERHLPAGAEALGSLAPLLP
jgi:hypothetical protein